MATKRSPRPSKTPAKTPVPPPVLHYLIEVSVDKKGNFSYTANGKDARTLRPNLGDTISWSVRVNGKREPFQIEFPGYGPFGYLTREIRSASKPTKPLVVTLPKNYGGNLVMKYRVTVPGSWSDDPDIVPPSADGLHSLGRTPQVVALDTDASGQLTLNRANSSFAAGEVTWQWAGPPQDDFVLTFDTPGAGWPKNPTTSVNGVIVLPLMTPSSNQGYKIVTVHSSLQAHGVLTIV